MVEDLRAGPGWGVRQIQPWRARCRYVMACDLGDAVASLVGDHDLVAVDPDVGGLVAQLVRDRVADVAPRDRRTPGDHAGLAERGDVRVGRHRMQPSLFLGEHVERWPAGLAVWTGVHGVTPQRRLRPELAEAVVTLT